MREKANVETPFKFNYSNDEDDLSSVHDFFTDDDGRSILDSVDPIKSRMSFASVQSSATVISRGILKLSLLDLCAFIREHRSLRRAQIVRVSSYSTRVNVVIVHRYLLLQLRREGTKKDIWVRVERLSRGGISGIFRGAGRTPSNDTASLAASPELLISLSKQESELAFMSSPSLDDFRRFLLIICEELIWYTPWPENCWMFCSLLQEHLIEIGNGWFPSGQLQHPRLAPEVRERVRSRIQAEAPPVTEPIPKLQSLLSAKEQLRSYDPYAIYLGISQSGISTSSHPTLADSRTVVFPPVAFPPSTEASPISPNGVGHGVFPGEVAHYQGHEPRPNNDTAPDAITFRSQDLRETCEKAGKAAKSLQNLLPSMDVDFTFLQKEHIIEEADLYHFGELQRHLIILRDSLNWAAVHTVDLARTREELGRMPLLGLMQSTIQSAEDVLELREQRLIGWRAGIQRGENVNEGPKEAKPDSRSVGRFEFPDLSPSLHQWQTIRPDRDKSPERPSMMALGKRIPLEPSPYIPSNKNQLTLTFHLRSTSLDSIFDAQDLTPERSRFWRPTVYVYDAAAVPYTERQWDILRWENIEAFGEWSDNEDSSLHPNVEPRKPPPVRSQSGQSSMHVNDAAAEASHEEGQYPWDPPPRKTTVQIGLRSDKGSPPDAVVEHKKAFSSAHSPRPGPYVYDAVAEIRSAMEWEHLRLENMETFGPWRDGEDLDED